MRTSSVGRNKRLPGRLGAWVAGVAAVLGLPGAAGALVVEVCDTRGKCLILVDVPPCEELTLPEGHTCTYICAMANLGGFEDPSGRGHVGVLGAVGGAVLAVLSDGSGAEAGRVHLLDFAPYLERGPLRVGADVRAEGPALFLDLEVSVIDPGTLEARETFVESIDVTVLAFGSACPADVNGDAKLNIRDFVAYQDMFRRSDPLADFDRDGALSINDFIAFRSSFAGGCR